MVSKEELSVLLLHVEEERRRRSNMMLLYDARRQKKRRAAERPGQGGSEPGRLWKAPRMQKDSSTWRDYYTKPEMCSDATFMKLFRVPRAVFDKLQVDLKSMLEPGERSFRQDAISHTECILLGLTYAATPGGRIGLSHTEWTGRAASTLREKADQVFEAVCAKYKEDVIAIPSTSTEIEVIMAHILENRGLPGNVGAIDGKCFQVLGGTSDEKFQLTNWHGQKSLNCLAWVHHGAHT